MKKHRSFLAPSSIFTLTAALMIGSGVPVEGGEEHRVKRERGSSGDPHFVTPPVLRPNPNPKVPLAAVLSFEASEPVTTIVSVTDGVHQWELTFDPEDNPGDGLAIVGMRPERLHTLQVRLEDLDGNHTEGTVPLSFTTPPLPPNSADFPDLNITVNQGSAMEPGVTLVSFQRRDLRKPRTPTSEPVFGTDQGFGLLLVMDAAGEVIWYYQEDEFRITDVEFLDNGNLIFLTSDFRALEIDRLGNTLQQWYAAGRPEGKVEGIPVDTLSFHHEINDLPNGNLMVLGGSLRNIENYYTSETDPNAPRATQKVKGDQMIEFTRNGEVVWRWDTFDFLDPFRIGYQTFSGFWERRGFPGVLDWSHGNNIVFNPQDNSLLFSLRYQEAIVKVDRQTQDILWILGEPSGWSETYRDKLFRLEGEGTWFYHQHSPEITPNGILIFDNGSFQARPFDPPVPVAATQSRAVEYALDETTMTARQIWSSEDIPNDRKLIDFAIGDADLLPQTGNVLLGYGVLLPEDQIETLNWQTGWLAPGFTLIREVKRTTPTEIVWEVVIENHDQETFGGWVAPYVERLPRFW